MEHKRPPLVSTIFYGLSIGLILLHIQQLTIPLANLTFFISALTLGCILSLFCLRIPQKNHRWKLLILLSFPWIIKSALVGISFFIAPMDVGFDRRLLFFDRNFLIVLFPWYWITLSTYMAGSSYSGLHWNRILNGIFLICFFIIIKSRQFILYTWPMELLAIFALIMLLQFLALMLAHPLQTRGFKYNSIATLVVLLVLGLFSVVLLRKPAEEQATEQGGGLIKPDLFRFDFSQFLRLESEISLKEDMVLIVHKDPEASSIFIRRYILSGYDTRKGFYRAPELDDAEHPQELPPAELELFIPQWQDRRTTEQEYFLVNFDPSAFLGMNTPRLISPLKTWDTTSFSSAYRVLSETSEALPFELLDAVSDKDYARTKIGLTEQEYQWYTNYGKDQRIKDLGDRITEGLELYWEKVQAIYEYLKNGEYRYSLKPGLASDGDQLGRFLFDTKRGYCSYFAFSMALLLRSQGIPARVAVGFFIDPDSGAFNYYPILSNMAHAWVEVYYPKYGWIDYDPTTTFLAEGETFRFSQGAQQQTFERLLGEILQNRDKLAVMNNETVTPAAQGFSVIVRSTGLWLKAHWPGFVFFFYVITMICLRYGYYLLYWYHLTISRNYRHAAQKGFSHSLRILRLAGIYQPKLNQTQSLQEQVQIIEQNQGLIIIPLFNIYEEARFTFPSHSISVSSIQESYAHFIGSYKQHIPLTRRIFAQAFPFITMALPPKRNTNSIFLIILLTATLFLGRSSLIAESSSELLQNTMAQELLRTAQELRQEERWEQAIELLQKGEKLYPSDSRFPAALGDIYQNRGLYSLAWNEYHRAEALDQNNRELWYELSIVAGRLNKNDESIWYLERLLSEEPNNKDAIGDLGWMYFKTHRLSEGEELLRKALERLGPDQGLEMTLATIYSDQYRYDDAKHYYISAIQHAEKSGFKLFLAVAYYNLSILESRFYRFADAFNSTHHSLQYTERASGHLARGELFQRRLDFSKAHGEYTAAYELDTSPLSKINIAQLYQQTGNLKEAKTYAENTLQQRDLSWMLNYGTDIDRYHKDLHQILRDVYRGLVNTEKLSYRGNLWQYVQSHITTLKYSIHAFWQDQLFTYYTLQAADAYGVENQRLDALLHYYLALQQYPWRAKPYLQAAMDYETRLIEASRPSYLYEMGKLEQKSSLLLQAIDLFDPIWERDMIADAYAELAHIYQKQGNIDGIQASIEALYALNRGALLQRGLRLPINLEIDGVFTTPTEQRNYQNIITTVVNKSGLRSLNATPARFKLILNYHGDTIKATLWDSVKGTNIREHLIPLSNLSPENLQQFSRELQKTLFSELGQ
ncbi:transglutaminase domain-containing protein [Gracilinema caldarium]|uniref:Transglutaminase domain-containing protein n=1 Tax=Gracilinema caldarium (strain ATCC 51460 / DSM 7334 / H1) TaxID=744872 RepID=F8F3B0_GRAC1|nr:transglutaminase domain-containing protein [Gracilinema caldarium]AEJ20947.1 transglutaminase domain-containing protein [Gracilinema caldarium DSM 7334]